MRKTSFLKKSSRIAVIDLTHGGLVIARKLNKMSCSISGIDVYGTINPDLQIILKKEGIKVSAEYTNPLDFDVIISPTHFDSNNQMITKAISHKIPVLSHHQAVGQILFEYDLRNKTIIELTGTKAKTSTAILLANILSKEKKVISHTSRGLENQDTGKIIKKGLSITPANILTAIDEINNNGIDFNVLIAEVSIGGTGYADIGVITTTANDYKIANNTKLASDAKRNMMLYAKPGSKLVVNNDVLRLGDCIKDVDIISFTDTDDNSCNVYYENFYKKGGTIAYSIGSRQGKINIQESSDYDISSYKTAFVCATATAILFDIDPNVIENSFLEFKGVQSRMTRKIVNGRIFIDNSNSGMNIISTEKALRYAQEEEKRIVMILGEEAKEVCEGLDPKEVEIFIDDHLGELDAIVLVGERMKHLVKNARIYYAEDLISGIELTKFLTRKNDIILCCVKCFR